MSAIQNLHASLSGSLIERDEEVRAVLLGLVAREHVLLVGPPGTAKSMLATGLTQAIDGAHSFSVLLTKYTTPEEVYGPVKLSALKEDRYERATSGYAPTAHVLFSDEIWKASSAILNTLLTLLQERAYDNGGVRTSCPLRLCVAASNEWPSTEEGQELGAVFDRFLIRRLVRPVSPQGRARLLYEDLPPVAPCVTLAEIDAAADAAAVLSVSDEAKSAMDSILAELAAAGIRPGDRRCRKAIGIARAAAFLDGAAAVEPRHLEPLGDVLWDDPTDQPEKCSEIVTAIANPVGAKLNELLREVSEAVQSATDAAARMTAIKKVEECEKAAKKLTADGNGRAAKAHEYIQRERARLQAAALGIDPEKAAALLGRGL